MMKSSLLACGLLIGLALPAAAAETATLTYADLDFSKPADVAAFNTRLDAFLKTACKGNNAVQLDGNRRITCKQSVKERALARLTDAQRAALAPSRN